ncbi:MAG: GNAT family N-acetyltransferase [Flavobacteriaceae bacterium]
MTLIVRTNSDNEAFKRLVAQLDSDLAERDGDEHAFYDQFNKITSIKHALIVFEDNIAVGCGAIKDFEANAMEVKRMFVIPQFRGKGLATKILSELEAWAKELTYHKCVLETGKRQPEAIALYKKNGYRVIPNYGQYKGVENSVCFEKLLS